MSILQFSNGILGLQNQNSAIELASAIIALKQECRTSQILDNIGSGTDWMKLSVIGYLFQTGSYNPTAQSVLGIVKNWGTQQQKIAYLWSLITYAANPNFLNTVGLKVSSAYQISPGDFALSLASASNMLYKMYIGVGQDCLSSVALKRLVDGTFVGSYATGQSNNIIIQGGMFQFGLYIGGNTMFRQKGSSNMQGVLIPQNVKKIIQDMVKNWNVVNSVFNTGSVTNSFAQNQTSLLNLSNPFNKKQALSFNIFNKPSFTGQMLNQALSNQMYKNKSTYQNMLLQNMKKLGGNAMMFPNWVAASNNITNQRKARSQQIQQIQKRLKNPADTQLSQLSKYDPDKYKWNQQQGRWQGSAVLTRLLKDPQQINRNFVRKAQKSQLLLNQTANQEMIDKNVPQMVKILIGASQDLSDAGIGPIKPGGVPLYAGRWIDSATGGIRLFPKANRTYINPSNKNQQLGYMQAKILNKWNQYVDATENYIKLANTPPQKIKTNAYKRIQLLANNKNLVKKAFYKLSSQAQKAILKDFNGNVQKQIFWNLIDPAQLLQTMAPYKKDGNLTGFVQQLKIYVQKAIQKMVGNMDLGDQQLNKLLVKVMNYANSLMDIQYDMQTRAVNSITSLTIPSSVSMKQVASLKQTVQSNKQLIKKNLKSNKVDKKKLLQIASQANNLDQLKQKSKQLDNIFTTQKRTTIFNTDNLKGNQTKSQKQKFRNLIRNSGLNRGLLQMIQSYGPSSTQDAQKLINLTKNLYNSNPLLTLQTLISKAKQAGINGSGIFS